MPSLQANISCWKFIIEALYQRFHLLYNSGAQLEIFQGRGDLVGLGHFYKHFIKTPRKKTLQEKIWEFFLLDIPKTKF